VLILFHGTLQGDTVGGDVILAGGDSIEEANSFAGIDGGLRSCPLKSVEPFEGWKVEGRKRKSDQPATSDEQRRKKGLLLKYQNTYCREGQ
jgi:hypothetical protein